MFRKSTILLGGFAVATVLAGGAPNAAEKPVVLTFSHFIPPTHIQVSGGFAPWFKSIEKASGGSIKFKIYPSQQLGKAKDHFDMVKNGIADMAFVNPGYTPGRFPIISLGELPFTFPDAEDSSAAFWDWYQQYAPDEMRDVRVLNAYMHAPGTFHSKKVITRPEHMKGVKLRPAHGTLGRWATMLGGSSVHISIMEARDALEKGLADATTLPWQALITWRMDKAVKQHMDARVYVTTFVTPMNKAKYNQLTRSQKKVIDDHSTADWARRIATPWSREEEGGYAKVAKLPGHSINKLTADDLAAWRKAAVPLREAWAKDVKKRYPNTDPDEVYANLLASLKKYGVKSP